MNVPAFISQVPCVFVPTQINTSQSAEHFVNEIKSKYLRDINIVTRWVLSDSQPGYDANIEKLSHYALGIEPILGWLSLLLPAGISEIVVAVVVSVQHRGGKAFESSSRRRPEFVVTPTIVQKMVDFLEAVTLQFCLILQWINTEEAARHRASVFRALQDMQQSMGRWMASRWFSDANTSSGSSVSLPEDIFDMTTLTSDDTTSSDSPQAQRPLTPPTPSYPYDSLCQSACQGIITCTVPDKGKGLSALFPPHSHLPITRFPRKRKSADGGYEFINRFESGDEDRRGFKVARRSDAPVTSSTCAKHPYSDDGWSDLQSRRRSQRRYSRDSAVQHWRRTVSDNPEDMLMDVDTELFYKPPKIHYDSMPQYWTPDTRSIFSCDKQDNQAKNTSVISERPFSWLWSINRIFPWGWS